MKKDHRRALTLRFDEFFSARGFSRVTPPPKFYRSVEQIYEKAIQGKGCAYYVVSEHPSWSGYLTVEVGWSVRCKPPEMTLRPLDFELDNPLLFTFDQFLCRLPGLVYDRDGFWVISEQVFSKNLWVMDFTVKKSTVPSPFELIDQHGAGFISRWTDQKVSE
jgi:hypothetical protein